MKIQPGDIFCPKCFSDDLVWHWDDGTDYFTCEARCGRINLGWREDSNGRFEWIWGSASFPKPNPGCPWCGSCNIGVGLDSSWSCRRCGKYWRGKWKFPAYRWLIFFPVTLVPWATGSSADLECRRNKTWDFTPGEDRYGPSCCRFPKSCSAYDFLTTGVGPKPIEILDDDDDDYWVDYE